MVKQSNIAKCSNTDINEYLTTAKTQLETEHVNEPLDFCDVKVCGRTLNFKIKNRIAEEVSFDIFFSDQVYAVSHFN
jgi:hypothetical protein